MDSELPPLPGQPNGRRGMSLAARLFNVFATPGDVFDEVKPDKHCVSNWSVPLLLTCLVVVISVLVIFSQEVLYHQIMEQREQAVEKKLRQLPKEQQEQARAAMEKFSSPTLLKTFAPVGAAVSSVGWLFGVALLVWLLGRFGFKSEFRYGQSLEVCGLASMITVLNMIFSTLLTVGMGNLYASPGPALLIQEFDPANRVHLALGAFNLLTLWYLGTLAVGVAKLGKTSFFKALIWVAVPWAVVRFGLIWLT